MRHLVTPCFLAILVLQAHFGVGAKPKKEAPPAHPLVAAARKQIGVTVRYDSKYVRLEFPNGDIPKETGVCTDVVVRALRDAYQFDLQKEIHEDMSASFAEYPKRWGLKGPNSDIDHRRVPNLEKFFERKGFKLPVPKDAKDFKPGDIVTCMVAPDKPHIMIVSDRRNKKGIPLVIHNSGGGTRENNRLTRFKISGRYQPSLGPYGKPKKKLTRAPRMLIPLR